MEHSGEHADKPLPLSKVVRVDEVCHRFDHAIHDAIQQRGSWPGIEDYLGDTTEPLRSQLRKELLAVEMSYRQQQAEGGNPDSPSESSPRTCLWQPGEPKSRQTGETSTSKRPEAEKGTVHPGRIGRYWVEQVLGKGAFGTVYKGYDDDLKRHVAIKVPNRELVDKPEDIELYLEEAQVVASLDHANIVPVHDVGRTEDGCATSSPSSFKEATWQRKIEEQIPLSHYASQPRSLPQSPKPCTTPIANGSTSGREARQHPD